MCLDREQFGSCASVGENRAYTTNQARQLGEEVRNHYCLSGKPASNMCWRDISDSMPLRASDIRLFPSASAYNYFIAHSGCLSNSVRSPVRSNVLEVDLPVRNGVKPMETVGTLSRACRNWMRSASVLPT